MELNVIFDAIVPDNIKNIPLVQKSLSIFIEMLNRNSAISQRILKLYSIDDETWYTKDEQGNELVVTDSKFLKQSKDNLKKGLFMTYLGLLYDCITKAQLNNNIRVATKMRNYKSSLIFEEQHNILTSEFLGSFRTVQQTIGTENSLHYIYQFARYLETGYLSDDLTLDSKVPSNFVMNYEGSLHKYYFSEFMHDLAHPIGWIYAYTTMLSFILEDYFGIAFTYKLPRIVLRRADKYIFFTNLVPTEFLDNLREAVKSDETRRNTIWKEGPLYYSKHLDEQGNNSINDYNRSITVSDIEKMVIKQLDGEFNPEYIDMYMDDCDILLVPYEFEKYDFYYGENQECKNSLVTFSNDSSLYYDNNNVYFGKLDYYDVEPDLTKMYKLDPFWILDCGSVKEINDLSDYKFLYTDDVVFEVSVEPTYGKYKYLEPNLSKAFKLYGQSMIYTQGYDEGNSNAVAVRDDQKDLRIWDEQFIFDMNFKNDFETYIHISDQYGHSFRKTYCEGENKSTVNISGWSGELNIRTLTTDSDMYITTNIMDLLNTEVKDTWITEWTYNDRTSRLIIKGKSNLPSLDINFNGDKSTINVNNGEFRIERKINDTLILYINKLYIKTNLFVENYHNTELQMPVFKKVNLTPKITQPNVTKITNTESMKQYPSSGSKLSELHSYSFGQMELMGSDYINLDNFLEYNLTGLNEVLTPQEVFINKGYEYFDCDTSEQFITDNTKRIKDNIFIDIIGKDYFLIFNNDEDGCDFIDYNDAKNHGFVTNNKENTFLFTVELGGYPETIDRASWLRVNNVITAKRND